MQTVRQAMRIVSKELKNDKLQIIWTILFMLYMGLVISYLINSLFEERFYNPFADFMMIMFSSMLGYSFSRRSFKFLMEDSYTQVLYYYRSVPVPTEAVIVSRAIFGIVSFAVNSVVFFGLVYFIAADLRTALNLAAYISFGLTWVGLGILVNGLHIYFENLISGKAYFWMTIGLLILIGFIILVLFLIGFKFSLFYFVADASKKWELLSPVMWGSLLIGLAGYAGMCRLTYKRMLVRDLS